MVRPLMTTLLCLLALSPALAEGADPDALLHEARARARHGDYEGVRIVAEQALAIDGDHQRTAQYLIAMSWEFGGDPTHALAIYDALAEAWPRRQVPEDLALRRAECLARLGRYGDARRALRSVDERLETQILKGVWDLELGRDRRGLRRLAETLDGADPQVGAWYQAQARHALLSSAVEHAAAHDLDGKRPDEALEARAQLLEVAREQLAAAIRLEEPAFALDGFLLVARAYADLGQEMLDADVHSDRVEAVWTKAVMFYDRGIDLATRAAWTGAPVPTLRAELEALTAKVDGR